MEIKLTNLFLLISIFFVFTSSAQSTDLLIQKTGSTSAYFGQNMTYTITVSNSGTQVSNASFNDDFPLNVSNVSLVSCIALGGAICPSVLDYSISNTNFSGTIPLLPHGGSVEFVISLNAPLFTNGLTSISNTASVSVPLGVTELDSTTNSSTWNTTLLNEIDISSTVESSNLNNLGNCTSYPFTTNYTVQWINNGPSIDLNTELLNAISFKNSSSLSIYSSFTYLDYSINNVQWTTSNPSTNIIGGTFNSLSGNLILTDIDYEISILNITEVFNFFSGDTITLNYSFILENPTYLGCGTGFTYDLYNNSSFSLGNNDLNDINTSNNSDESINMSGICDIAPFCPLIDIGTTIEASDTLPLGDCLNYPFSVDYTVKWFNNGLVPDTNTALSNIIRFINVVTPPLGGAIYNFPYEISNVQWYTNSTLIPVPSSTFKLLMDTISIPQSTFAIPSLDTTIIPYFYVGDTFILSYTFTIDTPQTENCGVGYDYDLMSQSLFEIGSDVLIDTITENNSASEISFDGTCHLTDPCDEVDISSFVSIYTNSITGNCSYPFEIDFDVEWINLGPANAPNVTLQNLIFFSNVMALGSGNSVFNFPYEFSDVSWYSSNDSTTPAPTTSLASLIGNAQMPSPSALNNLAPTNIPMFSAGDTLVLSYTFTIYGPTLTGCGNNISYEIASGALFEMNNSLEEPNVNNNTYFDAVSGSTVTAVDLAISESVSPAIVNHLDTTEITILFQNGSSSATNNASWSQILPSEFEIIPSTISCNTISGTTLCSPINYNPITKEISQTIPVMEANSIVEIKFRGVANSVNSTTVNLEANALINCFDCIPSTNFTQTTFQIDGLCELAYAGEIFLDPSSCITSDGLASILTFGPYIGNLNYEWFDSTGVQLIGQNNDTAFNLIAGEYTVIVSDDGVVGCQIQESIILSCIDLGDPYAGNDSITILEDTSAIIEILINDIDTNGFIDSSSLDLNPNVPGIQDTLLSNDGLWYTDTNGNVFFDPNENFVGNTSINYTILDNDSLVSNVATIYVEVIEVNDPPFANNDFDTLSINTIIVVDVLNNDSDSLDLSGSLDTNSLTIITNPSFGELEIDSISGEISYTPDSGFVGTDSFQYIICDNGNPVLCDSAWVFLTVEEILIINGIIAINDTVETTQNESIDIQVLINDTSFNSSIDSGSLNIWSLPNNGTVVISSNQIIYTPNNLFFGVDSFQYVICDNGNGNALNIVCDTAIVYIYIVEVPIAEDCEIIIPEGISPNSDGLNDFWRINGLTCFPNNMVRIFNRWGAMVFKADNYQNNWDGINNFDTFFGDNNKLPEGTYFYILELEKGGKTYKGFIYLTR